MNAYSFSLRLRAGRLARTIFWVTVCCLMQARTCLSADDLTQAQRQAIDTQQLEAQKKRIDSSTAIDAARKTALAALYDDALAGASETRNAQQNLSSFTEKIRLLPGEVNALRAELDALRGKPEQAVTDKVTSLPEVERLLQQRESQRAALEESKEKVSKDLDTRKTRRQEIPGLLQQLRATSVSLATVARQPIPRPEQGEDAYARALNSLARYQAATVSIAALNKELEYYDASEEQLRIQGELYDFALSRATNEVTAWRERANQLRASEADKQVAQAEQAVNESDPLVAPLSEKNAALASERRSLVEKTGSISNLLEQMERDRNAVAERFRRARERVSGREFSEIVGDVLWREKISLPTPSTLHQQLAQLEAESRAAEERRYDLSESLGKMHSDAAERDLFLSGIPTINALDPSALNSLRKTVDHLLSTQREYTSALIGDYARYLELLVRATSSMQLYVDEVDQYSVFLGERILWVRNARPLSLADESRAVNAIEWLISPRQWGDVAGSLFTSDILKEWPTWIVFLCALLGLLQAKRRLTVRQAPVEEKDIDVVKIQELSLRLLRSAVAALIIPTVVAFLAMRLLQMEPGSDFARAIGQGLLTISAPLAALGFVRRIVRDPLISARFFSLSIPVRNALRRSVRWLIAAAPLLAVEAAISASGEHRFESSLGRLLLCAFLCVAGLVLRHILGPRYGALFRRPLMISTSSITYRFRYVWASALCIMPAALIVLALVGYHYTARLLLFNIFSTIGFLLCVLVVRALALGWLLMTQEKSGDVTPLTPPAPLPADKADPGETIVRSTEDIRVLVSTLALITAILGSWLIWKDVIPALFMLKAAPGWGDVSQLTLGDLVTALLVAVLAFIATKNLPQMLDFTVIRNLPIDAGARYAVLTLARYSTATLGILAVFQVLGVSWSSVQWLVAAVGVGLGFGLQEIFANFVSGIILLFERPVRVGDMVTIGDVTGNVSRIRIRATTISDFELRELVVPNKELITNRLINWTLSDTVSRMTVRVGVAYGSDPNAVRTLLLHIAERHPLVLREPAPHALFDEFGDSALQFVLRVYMSSRSVYLQLRHELLSDIAEEFSKAGITIPYPHRDIRIENLPQIMAAG